MGMLSGKNGIVVGASQGIGQGIAELFCEEGANIIMTARGLEKLQAACDEINSKGFEGRAIAMKADAKSSEDATAVFKACVDNFGKVDFLVHNAAIGEMATLESVSDERITDVLVTNLQGPMVYCREALKYMMPQKSGSIVNISSINGCRPLAGMAYASSKGGLNTFTEAMAIYLVHTDCNVRINALCPGATDTPTAFHHDVVPTRVAEGSMVEIRDARSVRRQNLRSVPREQAKAALFLVSDWSSACNGVILRADHGSYL